jgi:molybdopterin-biosynthesis enzyme MoeA-like protein
MQIGALIIGDEIMRGKRQDQHFRKLVELLGARGMRLGWAQYLGDERPQIIAQLRRSFATDDVVFCFGGIGATPDDHTRQCAAAALNVELELRPEAAALIHASMRRRFGGDANAQQLQMGVFPCGAQIIPNAYNGIPGFSLRDHHFMPGFPVMAHPMVEWLLDQRYAHLHYRDPEGEDSIFVYGLMESTLTPLMEELQRSHRGLRVFSLPHLGGGGIKRHIELGLRGDPAQLASAMQRMREAVCALGGSFDEAGPALE